MKTFGKTKLTALYIAIITVTFSIFGVVKNLNPINFFFPIYAGLTLISVTLWGKEENKEQHTTVLGMK